MNNQDHETQLIEDIASFEKDPYGYVMYAFPWGEGTLKKWEGPKEWQKEILIEIGEKLKELEDPEEVFETAIQEAVASGHGIGKAQPNSLIIETPQGPKKWGDLSVGDEVFGVDGRPVKIVAVHPQGQKDIYSVNFDDGSSTLTCKDHVWTVKGRQERRRSKDFIEITTGQLLESKIKRSNGKSVARQFEIPTQSPVEYPTKTLPIHPYLMGVWLGDGSKNKAGFTKQYPEIAEKLKGLGYDIVERKGYYYSVRGCVDDFRKTGVFDLKSCERYVPSDFLRGSIDQRLELLRGLLDTDGEVSTKGSVIYNTTSPRLRDDVLFLGRSLGFKCKVQPTHKQGAYLSDGERVECRTCYRITISTNDVSLFYTQKRAIRQKSFEDRYIKRWIDSIELIGREECQCITVANADGLYLTNDFIVTHNSALVAWIILWGMSTFEDCKGVVTANTENQLKTKTWAEVSKWHSLMINKHWFKFTATALFSTDPDHERTWRFDMIPWSERNTEAFAGLHNEGKRIIVIFDEASAIPDVIWEVTEGALTDEDTQIMWIAFGNPTRNTGRFRECFRRLKHRWLNRQIDSRTVEGTNKKQLQNWVDDYGENSDMVKIRVRGMFPSVSARQFISTDYVDNAYGKHLREQQYDFAPKIITVDPAWTGEDELVIAMRQGLAFKILKVMPKNDNDVLVANTIAQLEDQENADAVFIDLGYGTGIYSAGKTMGRDWMLVGFNDRSDDEGCLNKRAEMWKKGRDWLREGGAIPEDQGLYDELIGPETVPRHDGKIQIESKESMKKRGLASPNKADTLMMSFAYPVSKKENFDSSMVGKAKTEYDPFN